MLVCGELRKSAICEYVSSGNTFRTKDQLRIRLAGVISHRPGTTADGIYKKVLEELVLEKTIVYKRMSTSGNIVVADVWVNDIWVNDYMRTMVFR
jgi:hypothetical protein